MLLGLCDVVRLVDCVGDRDCDLLLVAVAVGDCVWLRDRDCVCEAVFVIV